MLASPSPSAPWPRPSAFAGLCLALTALLGCPAEPPATPDGGVSQSALSCSSDAECSGGFVCDRIRRSCVCTRDEVCTDPARPYCNAFTGRCVEEVAGCVRDSDCTPQEFCDAAVRTCRARLGWCAPCADDRECGGAEDRCVVHPEFTSAPRFCGKACDAGGGCPDGQSCRETDRGRQCIPATGRCSTYEESCVPDTRQPCATDVDCTEGVRQICDRALRQCVAAESTCPGGRVCDPISRRCELPCREDNECRVRHEDPTLVCQSRTCTVPDTCYRDSECDANRFCYREPGLSVDAPGACRPTCASNSECPLGQVCAEDPVSSRKRCLTGCVNGSNASCPINAVCQGGACATTNSTGQRHCQIRQACNFKEYCRANVCVPGTEHCQKCGGAQSCPAGTSCLRVPFNLSCSPVTCPPGYVGDSKTGTRECGTGRAYWCWANICAVSGCRGPTMADDDCPQGFECQSWNQAYYCVPRDAAGCLGL